MVLKCIRALSLLLLMSTSLLATERYGDVYVMPIPLANNTEFSRGYREHRVKISNTSLKKSHSVTLIYPNQSYSGGGNSISRITRTVTVSPSSTVQVVLYQPSIYLSGGGGIKVSIDGGTPSKRVIPVSSAGYYRGLGSNSKKNILSARGSDASHLEVQLDKTLPMVPVSSRGRRSSSPSSRRSLMRQWMITRAEADVEEWSDNWLAYSGYDAVVLSGDKLDDIPPSVFSALMRYIQTGGVVLVTDGYRLPAKMNARRGKLGGLDVQYLGFGMMISTPDKDLSGLDMNKAKRFLSILGDGSLRWKGNRAFEAIHKRVPVVENLRVPVRGLFIMIILFSIIIGPVNLVVLARMKRRIWLLWTVPAISFIACIAIVIYSLFSEGITPTVRIEGMTLLNEKTRMTATVGVAGYYCPLTPGDGLHFSYDSELTPMLNSGRYNGGTTRTMDWSRDQHLESGWVTARIPAYFMLRKSEVRRERLNVVGKEDGTISVVNGLGADIKELYLLDIDGKAYEGKMLEAGKQVTLKSTSSPLSTANSDVLWNTFTSPELVDYLKYAENPYTYLEAGMYMAVFNDAPFIEKGLAGKVKGECKSIVVGIMSEENRGQGGKESKN